jgi:hypothetical protein
VGVAQIREENVISFLSSPREDVVRNRYHLELNLCILLFTNIKYEKNVFKVNVDSMVNSFIKHLLLQLLKIASFNKLLRTRIIVPRDVHLLKPEIQLAKFAHFREITAVC